MTQVTFEEISASDYVSLYNQGYSINELKKIMIFQNCKNKEDVLKILDFGYNELKGG